MMVALSLANEDKVVALAFRFVGTQPFNLTYENRLQNTDGTGLQILTNVYRCMCLFVKHEL